MKYLVFDFETDSLNTNFANPLTAYFILCDNEFKIIDELSLTFKPDVSKNNWNKQAELIHGIRFETAIKFDDPKESLQKLIDFIPDSEVCAVCFANYFTEYGCHYFDFAILKTAMDRHFEMNSWMGMFDYRVSIHTLYKDLQKIEPKLKGGAGLRDVCNQFGIKLDNHHDAKTDTIATYECLKAISKRLDVTSRLEPWHSISKNLKLEVTQYERLFKI